MLDGKEGMADLDGTFHDFCINVTGKVKSEQVRKTGARYLASPCANCKRQLTRLMAHHNPEVQVGGVFDLFARAVILDG